MSRSAATQAQWAIRGAEVIDGTGAPRYRADVLIDGGAIAAIVPPGEGRAAQQFDAGGKLVCPGFIDTHSHDDQLLLRPCLPHPKLSQGVTTVVTGNCGISLAPLVHGAPPPPLDILGADAFRFAAFGDYLAALDGTRLPVNVVPLVGHTTLRVGLVDDLGRAATPHETRAMQAQVVQALAEGAFGLSTGVYYPPAAAAGLDELHGVCAALQGRDAVLAMHIRDEGDRVEGAVQEALQVGAACGARLVLSHHKVAGAHNHGKTVRTLAAISAAAAHQSVCLDCYPYEASSTMLAPDKAVQVGTVLIAWSQPHPEMAGRMLASIAHDWGLGLRDAALRLMPGGAIYFNMAPEDVDRVISHPLAMIGSDGLPHDRWPHPRLWGTFPRVLGHYSRDRGLFPLEAAVHKMTGLPARTFGLSGRGRLAPGCAADLVVFDALQVRDNASYQQPTAAPWGIDAVFVNGALAVHGTAVLDVGAGRRLRPGAAMQGR